MFFGIVAAKNDEKSVSLTDSDVQTFLEGEGNQNTKGKTERYVISGFGNGISRGWERKSTIVRFATGRFWPCTWKTSFGKDQFNNWEFFILKVRLIVCFFSDSTHVFILSVSTHFKSFMRGLSIFYFHLLIKLTFLVSKGLYEISLLVLDAVPLVRYRVKHSKRNFISTRPYVLFSISLMSGSQNPIIEELGGIHGFC